MFQDFSDTSETEASAGRISCLREQLAARGLDGFIVPRADEFQGEYVPESSERLKWLTSFSGSAGCAVILAHKAGIFVDGRYTLQVKQQVDLSVLQPLSLYDDKPEAWAADNLPEGGKLGYDPWLLTVKDAQKFAGALKAKGGELVPVDTNPLDAVWPDQPAKPAGEVVAQPLELAGRTAGDKLDEIARGLKQRGASAHVLTQTDAVAWAFNIRGADIPHTPVPLAFAIVHADGTADLLIAPERMPDDAKAQLGERVRLHGPQAFTGLLEALATAREPVELDADWAADAIRMALEGAGASISTQQCPCTLPRAAKNTAELEGAREAHLRDAVAIARYLHWLSVHAPGGELDEITAAKKLEQFRTETNRLKDLSFDTISAAGPHAAIPHYRVSETTNLTIERDQIYLVDSGGQYVDGTTDITRTIIAGTPSAEMKDRNTRVLKGMISLSRARFPEGTTGGHLDALARTALWEAGLDFDHGTGHGVGSFLSVHEGPQRFSRLDQTKLLPGMIVSNEPGYYKAGEYGIRIENLVVVREAQAIEGGDRSMHWLETITFAPIDRALIEVELLTDAELDWLNAYHADVLEKVGPRLEDDSVKQWLQAACAPISR